MDNYRKFSEIVYGVEKETTNSGNVIKYKGAKYLVIDTIDTDKDTLGYEHELRSNSMQAMTVAEIKDEYKSYKDSKLKEIKGYPQSVINQNLTIVYAVPNHGKIGKPIFEKLVLMINTRLERSNLL